MFGLSPAADPVQLGPSMLRSSCTIGARRVRQLKKRLHRSNSAARGQIAFTFHMVVLCSTEETAELSKPVFMLFAILDTRSPFYQFHYCYVCTSFRLILYFTSCIFYIHNLI